MEREKRKEKESKTWMDLYIRWQIINESAQVSAYSCVFIEKQMFE